uniref:Leucine-rich repeat flightless-interacting protein 2 n=1 Tax=Globodera rostochiensis TaxID=31243 RepID=A0A914I739_GLORO
MSSYSSSRRRAPASSYMEEHVLDRISREAEERSNKKRQAREEARQIRMDCLEKSIKANDHKDYHLLVDNDNSEKVTELENKYQRAMLLYTQLDNEKSALLYEIDLLKDEMEEKDVTVFQVAKENREISEELKLLRKTVEALQLQHQQLKNEILQRDRLIHEHGFVIVEQDPNDDLFQPPTPSNSNESASGTSTHNSTKFDPILLSHVALSAIEKALPGTSSVDQKVQRLVESNRKLRNQIDETEKALYNHRRRQNEHHNSTGSTSSDEFVQRDSMKQLAELKLKLQEAEREKSALEGSLSRTETQLKRYKANAEQAEKEAEEIQKTNRQLKKELRDKEQALEESKETNSHLQSRLAKLHNSRRPI